MPRVRVRNKARVRAIIWGLERWGGEQGENDARVLSALDRLHFKFPFIKLIEKFWGVLLSR
jgi:hypothetical protein